MASRKTCDYGQESRPGSLFARGSGFLFGFKVSAMPMLAMRGMRFAPGWQLVSVQPEATLALRCCAQVTVLPALVNRLDGICEQVPGPLPVGIGMGE